MSSYYFLSEFKLGSSATKGMGPEEYVYNQFYEDFCFNVKNHSLPFFSKDPNKLPRELTTGKIINDENLLSLEQNASRNGYKSNLWIYGSDLEKLANEGIHLKLKSGTVPVLCMTKYKNQTHTSDELYISDGGTKGKFQFMYNFDSLDEYSKEKVKKYLEKANYVNSQYEESNYKNFVSNTKENAKNPSKELANAKERINENKIIEGINLGSAVSAHYRRTLVNSVGNKIGNSTNHNDMLNCYEACNTLVKKIEAGELNKARCMQQLEKSLDSGTWFAKCCTAKKYNFEFKKASEELQVAEANRNKHYDRSSIER